MKPKTLLILEDNEPVRIILTYHFSKEYHVVDFQNGMLGRAWIDEGNIPDLIITDTNMPVMDGESFLNCIKSHAFLKDIPVFVLSGEEDVTVRIRLLERGADDYILKPFNPEELKVRVKKRLERV